MPIQKIADDKLNRSGFAKDLTQAIIHRDTTEGLVIGMYGKWGSGKTSVINMIVEQLETLSSDMEQKLVIMRFNPWLCADPRQLISQFFKQLSSVVEEKYPEYKNICEYMGDYADVFDFAGSVAQLFNLPVIGALLSAGGKHHSKEVAKNNGNLQNIKDNAPCFGTACVYKFLPSFSSIWVNSPYFQ